MIEVRTEIEFPAPSDQVWAFFSNSANWPKIDGLLRDSRPGEPLPVGSARLIIIRPKGLPTLRVKPKIIVSEPGHLSWRGSVPGFSGEHYFKAEPTQGGKATRWIHGEKFGGFLAPLIMRFMRPRMEEAYGAFNANLSRALQTP